MPRHGCKSFELAKQNDKIWSFRRPCIVTALSLTPQCHKHCARRVDSSSSWLQLPATVHLPPTIYRGSHSVTLHGIEAVTQRITLSRCLAQSCRAVDTPTDSLAGEHGRTDGVGAVFWSLSWNNYVVSDVKCPLIATKARIRYKRENHYTNWKDTCYAPAP